MLRLVTVNDFSTARRESEMNGTPNRTPTPDRSGGSSVVLAATILPWAEVLDLPGQWKALGFGRSSGRAPAYAPQRRIAAVLPGLACGLRGVAPANRLVRPNPALRGRLGGRFPDQRTIPRWLARVTPDQAAARRH